MSKFLIKSIKARQILDSRGNPTVEVDVETGGGVVRASVPSGASTGTFEAFELRDGNKNLFHGKSVLKAVKNVNEIIAKRVVGMDCRNQEEIDKLMIELDGTENKSKLGANAILAVSIGVAKAAAVTEGIGVFKHLSNIYGSGGIRLPVPQFNVINSGRHAGIENDIQEHMIVPLGAKTFSEALRYGAEIYHELKGIIKKKYGIKDTHVGDEGGYVIHVNDVEKRLEVMEMAIEELGYSKKVAIALDCAASEFFKAGVYLVGDKKFTSSELVDFYGELIKKFRIFSIEDGLSEEDWDGWVMMNKELGKKVQVVGDDLLVTNPNRIKKAIEMHACNALLLKLNQIGTVTEAMHAAKMVSSNGWNIVVSHRSGETCDSFIADFSVGIGAGQIKSGAPARSERLAKYNQLLRIEETLGENAKFGLEK